MFINILSVLKSSVFPKFLNNYLELIKTVISTILLQILKRAKPYSDHLPPSFC